MYTYTHLTNIFLFIYVYVRMSMCVGTWGTEGPERALDSLEALLHGCEPSQVGVKL